MRESSLCMYVCSNLNNLTCSIVRICQPLVCKATNMMESRIDSKPGKMAGAGGRVLVKRKLCTVNDTLWMVPQWIFRDIYFAKYTYYTLV